MNPFEAHSPLFLLFELGLQHQIIANVAKLEQFVMVHHLLLNDSGRKCSHYFAYRPPLAVTKPSELAAAESHSQSHCSLQMGGAICMNIQKTVTKAWKSCTNSRISTHSDNACEKWSKKTKTTNSQNQKNKFFQCKSQRSIGAQCYCKKLQISSGHTQIFIWKIWTCSGKSGPFWNWNPPSLLLDMTAEKMDFVFWLWETLMTPNWVYVNHIKPCLFCNS